MLSTPLAITHTAVPQPLVCKNISCANRNKWNLDIRKSKFVDWQRVRVQENSAEIPAGSMPRTVDIILRNELVEKAKAASGGDAKDGDGMSEREKKQKAKNKAARGNHHRKDRATKKTGGVG